MAVCNLFSNLSSTKWRFCVLQENSIAPNLTFLIVTNGAVLFIFCRTNDATHEFSKRLIVMVQINISLKQKYSYKSL